MGVPERIQCTPKQNAFAVAYLELGEAAAAYRHAYSVRPDTKPDTIYRRANDLLKHPKVSRRIAELQAVAAQRHAITQDKLVAMAMEAFELAKSLEEPSAMNQSVATIARVTGHWNTRVDIGNSEPIRLAYIVPRGAEAPLEGEFTEVSEEGDDK